MADRSWDQPPTEETIFHTKRLDKVLHDGTLAYFKLKAITVL
jgi:hypothetical protein